MARTITNPQIGAYYNATCVIEIIDCPNCGIQFGVPERLVERAREENRAHMGEGNQLRLYCPLGHGISWSGLDEKQSLRKRLARERDRAGQLAHRADQAEASAKAHRGAATRARNERDAILTRIENGVCPVKGCGRSFKNVRRHMATQHPSFRIPDGD